MRNPFVLLGAFTLACSSSTPSFDAGSSNNPSPTPSSDAGSPPPPPPPSDASTPPPPPPPPPVVNGCTNYVDMTANGATITGPSGPSPSQFSPNCVHITVGQSVTWNLFLTVHQLAAFGGDSPSPILTTPFGDSSSTVTYAFPNAGTYGFECTVHPSIMFGAVYVTE